MTDGRLRWRPEPGPPRVPNPGLAGQRPGDADPRPGPFAGIPGQDTVFVGLVKDELNYATLRYRHSSSEWAGTCASTAG